MNGDSRVNRAVREAARSALEMKVESAGTPPGVGSKSPIDVSANLWAVAALCGCSLLALGVFRPWAPQPFDVLDFSEFLLVLQRFDGFWDRWRGMALYYASQGRVNEIGYGIIAGSYQLFGLDPLGWRLTWSVQMLLLPSAVYFTLRRFGAGRLGAVIGCSLYTVGTIPSGAWLRQTGEPLGTLFMLAAAVSAHGWLDRPANAGRITFVAACLTGMLLCKETLVACLPFLCAIAACWSVENDVRAPRLWRPVGSFASACLAACLMLAAALAWAAFHRFSEPYTALYGTSVLTGRSLAARMAQMTLPVFSYTELWRLLLFPPNLIFVVGAVGGLALLVRDGEARRSAKRKLLVAMSLPLAGILVYLPWPRFEPFYGIPFLFGVALAVAILVDASPLGPQSRLVLIVCWLFVLAGSALNAFGLAEFTRAHRQLNHEVARQIGRHSLADTVVVVTAGITAQSWQNPAATLGRYARAIGLTTEPPVLLDLDCRSDGQPQSLGEQARHVEFIFEAACGHAGEASRTIERSFSYFNWATWTLEQHVARVVVVEPTR